MKSLGDVNDHKFAAYLRKHDAVDRHTTKGNVTTWKSYDGAIVATCAYTGNKGMIKDVSIPEENVLMFTYLDTQVNLGAALPASLSKFLINNLGDRGFDTDWEVADYNRPGIVTLLGSYRVPEGNEMYNNWIEIEVNLDLPELSLFGITPLEGPDLTDAMKQHLEETIGAAITQWRAIVRQHLLMATVYQGETRPSLERALQVVAELAGDNNGDEVPEFTRGNQAAAINIVLDMRDTLIDG